MTRLLCSLAKWLDRYFHLPYEFFGEDDDLGDGRTQSLPLHARAWRVQQPVDSKDKLSSSLEEPEGLLGSHSFTESLLQDASEGSAVEEPPDARPKV